MIDAGALSVSPAGSPTPRLNGIARRESEVAHIVLSLPDIHCAGCIGTVERVLNNLPGVRSARVNLSRKRVSIDAPGLSVEPVIAALGAAGYVAHELDTATLGASDIDKRGRALLVRVAVAGFAMMNVMLFSIAVWSGASEATRIMFHWISAGIAIPTLLFSGQVFFSSAWGALSARRLNMDVPISVAIILAALMSVFETARGSEQVYFDAALSLTFFLLVGRYLDHRIRSAARSAAQELTALETTRITRIVGQKRETVGIGALNVGDHVVLPAGMRAPVDGTVVSGATNMDRSFLTGESMSVAAGPGSSIAAGEVNLSGPITMQATAVGENTTLRRMAALVENAEGARNRYTALADRAARIYAPAVHLLALIAFIGWVTLTGEVARSINIAIAVLIITCPCALGLAVPAVMTAASGRLFRLGLLIKTRTALERLAEVDTVVFDKTGTLTDGRITFDMGSLADQEKSVLAALAGSSSHPVARAILAALPDDIDVAVLEGIHETAGKGIEARWQEQSVRLGSGSWIGVEGSPAFAVEGRSLRVLALNERLRDGALDAIDRLKRSGFQLLLFSGDRPTAVQKVAADLGVEDFRAEMSPSDKQVALSDLSARGHRVLMVGDGLNDTVALAEAYASISPATALDAARAASDIVLLNGNLTVIPDAIETAKRARRRVIENFVIAAGYNLIAVPVAVLGFATPLAAAIAMSLSSITVLLNALRVR